MLLPSIFGENLFDDWMDFSFPEIPDVDKTLYGKHAKNMMKTDVKETEKGYLTISAEKGLDKEEKDKKDKYIRRERYAGSMSRTFYVGESVTENDIHAKYENGILTLDVPKEEAKKVPEKRYISIEG